MKFKKATIEYFKACVNFTIILNEENILLYGENGAGKSSIYEALYSVFYYLKNNKLSSGLINIENIFKNRNYASKSLKVILNFDNGVEIRRVDNDILNVNKLKNKNIYFATEKVFNNLIENNSNLYKFIEEELFFHFNKLKEIFLYNDFFNKISSLTDEENITPNHIKEKNEIDNKFKSKFETYFSEIRINRIISEDFKQNFSIKFKIEYPAPDITSKKFSLPIISILIDDIEQVDLRKHFNEAKLKLVSIAIYFSLIKKFTTRSSLKLIVLDDFLTSLDMSNRKLIIQYLLKNFKRYQKIVLTHNLQFFNLFIRLTKINEEDWDVKTLYQNPSDINIYNNEDNYLSKASEVFKSEEELISKLERTGNLLRKEYERIINEFSKLLLIGKSDQMNIIIELLKSSNKPVYKEPFKVLFEIRKKILEINSDLEIIDGGNPLSNVHSVKNKFLKLNKFIQKNEINISEARELINNTELYKSILLNPASHNDPESELYVMDVERSIELLKELNRILKEFKK